MGHHSVDDILDCYLRMGIKGLTGFVASRSSTLGKRLSFEQDSKDERDKTAAAAGHDGHNGSSTSRRNGASTCIPTPTPVIIDGSAFLYRVTRLHIDWVKGGEALALRRVLHGYVTAFRNVNLEPIFVWDGAFDSRKLETVKGRLQQGVRNSITYMRAGQSLRLNRGFQVETAVLPLLSFRMAIRILQTLQEGAGIPSVEQHFPAGEADPVIAELAVQKNAYILSQDSDFFVTSHGSRGYTPLDSLAFLYVPDKQPEDTAEALMVAAADADDADDRSWAPVKPSKASRRQHRAHDAHSTAMKSRTSVTLDTLHQASLMTCTLYEAEALR